MAQHARRIERHAASRMDGGVGAWQGPPRMLSIPASRPNAYTGSPLDRAGEKRDDVEFIGAALTHPDTLFVPVWRARSLMRGVADGHPEAVLLTGAAAEAVRMADGPWAFLGLWEGRPAFAVDFAGGMGLRITGRTGSPRRS